MFKRNLVRRTAAAIGVLSLSALGLAAAGGAASAAPAPGACHNLYVSYQGQVKTVDEGYNPEHPGRDNTATVYKISAKNNGAACTVSNPTVQVNLGGPTATLRNVGFGAGPYLAQHGQTLSADITVQNPDNFLTNAFVRGHHRFWFHGRRSFVEVVNPFSTASVVHLNVYVNGKWHNLFTGWNSGITFEVGPNFSVFATVSPAA